MTYKVYENTLLRLSFLRLNHIKIITVCNKGPKKIKIVGSEFIFTLDVARKPTAFVGMGWRGIDNRNIDYIFEWQQSQ